MWRIFAAPLALLFAVSAQAQENVTLKPGIGRDVVVRYCSVCHSLDYPRTNALFLDRQGWETEVDKMITAYGADWTCRCQDHRRLPGGELRQR
jgi:hypothetical protein